MQDIIPMVIQILLSVKYKLADDMVTMLYMNNEFNNNTTTVL